MDRDDQTARELELNRNEVKWQESVKRTADALRLARDEGYAAGLLAFLRPDYHDYPPLKTFLWPGKDGMRVRDFYAGEPCPQGDGDCR